MHTEADVKLHSTKFKRMEKNPPPPIELIYFYTYIQAIYVNNSDEVRSCTAFGRQNDSLESISSIVCISRSIQTMIFIRKKNGTIAKSGDFQHLSDGIDSQD